MSESGIPPTTQPQIPPPPPAEIPQSVIIGADQIEALPQKLAELRRAIQIEAILIRQNLETQEAILRTIHGEVRIKTDVPLPPNRTIIVQVPPGPAPQQITLLVPSAPEVFLAARAPAISPPATVPYIPVEAGATVQATLITPRQPPSPAPASAPQVSSSYPASAQQTPVPSLPRTVLSNILQSPVSLPQILPETVIPSLRAGPVIAALKAEFARLNLPQSLPHLQRPQPPQHTPGPPPAVLQENGQENLLRILQAQVLATRAWQTVQSAAPSVPQKEGTTAPPNPTPLVALPLVQELLARPDIPSHLTRALLPEVQKTLQQVIRDTQPPQSFHLRVISVTLPASGSIASVAVSPENSPEPLPLNTPLSGTVTGLTARSQPVIITDHGNLILNTATPLPKGTQITFEATRQPVQTTALAPETLPLSPLDPLRAESWPALDEALKVLTQQAPEAVQSLRAALPNTNVPARLPNAVLFFMAALKGGTLESWLGQPQLQALIKAERRDLIERLTTDFRGLARQSTEPLSGEWRSISLPFLQDDRLAQLQFFVRHQQNDAKNEKDKRDSKQTRFVINLKLSRIGPMQIDGLFKAKKLDLVVRSEHPLTERLRHELRENYRTVLENADLAGGLTFQAHRKGWIEIEELKNKVGVVA